MLQHLVNILIVMLFLLLIQSLQCEKPPENSELFTLVNRQVHRHSHTCKKKPQKLCRFNYPQPPMRSTQILYPLDPDIDHDELKHHKDMWKYVSSYISDMKEGENITLDELFEKLKISEQQYVLAIRSSLKGPTIFLKGKSGFTTI